MKEINVNYQKNYSEVAFNKKIKRVIGILGYKAISCLLLLYYTLSEKNTPSSVKLKIAAALGYFISPIDIVPDFMPVIGYTDDLALLAATITLISAHVTDQIRLRARNKIQLWFPKY
ncbi:MAG: YkvA family protein [Bacteroidota bacterium]|nr:YkvA family protein [Bacteroidota bacterium]